MVERNEITLLYQHDDNWIGGSYYIVNIIKALNLLKDDKKPLLKIYYDSKLAIKSVEELNYPYIFFAHFTIQKNFFTRVVNRLSKELFGRLFIKQKLSDLPINNLYPVADWVDVSNVSHFYYWIPDFQERYLTQFFSNKEIWQRSAYQKLLVERSYPIVFSSYNALEDFNKFYPKNNNRKEVLQFVSIIKDDYKDIPIQLLKDKFNIDQQYFISPNQFWQHKNQVILIKAAKVLKERNVNFLIVFTGKEFDHRDANYTVNLKKMIALNGLYKNFRFLGFIDRAEQLQLMKNSIAIIQPSLFEGWSTVVEDTKALNHVILLSDIALHREQIQDNCIFFNPNDEVDVANKIQYATKHSFATKVFDSEKDKLQFAEKVVSIFNQK
jgi:glycosyltransferase involved in cell wall biosynthesis